MRLYLMKRRPDGMVVAERHGCMTDARPLRRRHDLLDESPTFWDWGPPSPESLQLSVDILSDALASDALAICYAHDFAEEVLKGQEDFLLVITHRQVMDFIVKITLQEIRDRRFTLDEVPCDER